ncbi:alpha 1,2-mannosyltransferase 2.4.1 [Pleurotus pulmonarius]|nr:alpha 1,2-mannosyltransferase 2.4.1 [Pleurotus pulmonarius]
MTLGGGRKGAYCGPAQLRAVIVMFCVHSEISAVPGALDWYTVILAGSSGAGLPIFLCYIAILLNGPLQISLYYLLSFTREELGRIASMSNIVSHLQQHPASSDGATFSWDEVTIGVPSMDSDDDVYIVPKANAAFVVLARNSDIDATIKSIRDIEDHFNRRYLYPYVFLSEVEFSEAFKWRISNIASTPIEFGIIPHNHWYQPDWIDEAKARAARDKMAEHSIIYGGSVSYRNMCRFNSGFFYQHPLLQKYRWYWRIEPGAHFSCNINFDPFLYMETHNKTYDFINLHPEYLAEDNSMGYISDTAGETYNHCHFWGGFEIADLDFWRGEAYQAYFDYLDKQGGFYYEASTLSCHAPVHSIGAALFANRDQIHFFDEIGYEREPFMHCPRNREAWEAGQLFLFMVS